MNKNKKEEEPRNRKETKQPIASTVKNNEKKQPEEVKPKNPAKVRRIPLFFAIVFTIYELASIILYLTLSYNRSNFVKQKLYDPELCQLDSIIRIYHLIFNLAIIIFIALLTTLAYKDIINKHPTMISISSTISGILALVFWAAYSGVYFVTIKYNKHTISFVELQEILNSTSPVEFAFIYSKEFIKVHNCTTNPLTGVPTCSNQYSNCYSYNGLKFPLKSKLEDEIYDISDPPKFFFFKIEQVLNKSDEFQDQFNKTISQIKKCNAYDLKIKYFPLLNKTFAIANPNVPSYVSDKARKIAGFLGFGADYELYIKSIPVIKYEQRLNIDLDQNFNYSKIWTKKSCKEFGKCSVLNKKPFPSDDL